MAKIRNVSKSLASMEDLLQGKGVVTQTRGAQELPVHRIDVPFALDTEAEMVALDVTRYTRARIYSDATTFVDYIYDEAATSGITPTEGTGFWVERGVLATGTTTPRTLGDRFAEWVNASDFGADLSDPLHDDTVSFQAALDTGKSVCIAEGVLTLTNQVFTTSDSQKIVGASRLEIKSKALIGSGTKILVPLGTTIGKTVKTRRLARTTGADPDDSPISCLINLTGRGNTVSDLSIELECDYSDMSPSNVGADCDVAIYNHCQQDVEIKDISTLGYFRKAGLYLDVTATNNTPDRITGIIDTTRTTGSDRIKIDHVETDGSWKDIFLAGPILNGADTYYDNTVGLVSEARGGSGASDLLIGGNCYFHGRNHHSSYRGYDPVMNPDAEDIDAMTGSIVIDSRRGSASQGRTRRISIENVRITTFEAARIFTGRAYEVNLNWVHTEPGSTSNTRFDTLGNTINTSDTVNETYGPIACQTPVDNLSGTDQVHCYGVWGTGIVGAWTSTLVPNFDYTRRYINPQFGVTFDSDVTVGDDLVVSDTINAGGNINGASLTLTNNDEAFTPSFGFVAAPTFSVQVGKNSQIGNMNFIDILLTWTGLNTADTSSVGLFGLPTPKDSQSGFTTQIDELASDGLVNPHLLNFNDNGSSTQIGLYKAGVPVKYNSGDISASGTLALTLTYRS